MKRFVFRPLFLFLVILIPLLILNTEQITYSADVMKKIENRFVAAGWIVAGLVGFLTFIVLYLTIIFENRVFKNIRGINEYYFPYAIDLTGIQNKLHNYLISTRKTDLIFLYYIYTIAIISINSLWATIIKYYVPLGWEKVFNFKDWTVDLLSISGIILYALAISFWLFTILFGVVLLFIINDINIISKITLPKISEITSVSYLRTVKADISEIMFKISPKLSIYEFSDEECEMYIGTPISFYNVSYLFKFHYDHIRINLYYKVLNKLNTESILKNQLFKLENKDFKKIKEHLLRNDIICELQVYDTNGEIVGRYLCEVNNNKAEITFTPYKRINLDGSREGAKIKALSEGLHIEHNLDL